MQKKSQNPERRSPASSLRIPFIGYGLDRWRGVRRWTSRAEWNRRILGARSEFGVREGLVLIQIDGLSRQELENAVHAGKMPFLRHLLDREGYELHDHYSGIPSTTAAVQAELFFGVRTAVPAHAFGDRATGKVVAMLDPEVARKVQLRVSAGRDGLLEGGSAYSNIYTGGAAEPHFCAAAMGWGRLFEGVSPLRGLAFFAFNSGSFLRAAGSAALELGIAVVDCFRGITGWKDLRNQIKLIPSRVMVAVLLREWMTIAACVDAARGVPVVQLNYLGYDEHAHRRGPGSRYVLGTLKGIDRCIRRVWRAAVHSEQRHYQTWIYSDHGQERTTPYDVVTGRVIQDVVRDAFQPFYEDRTLVVGSGGEQPAPTRARYLRRGADPTSPAPSSLATSSTDNLIVAAIGPLGHIYLPAPLPPDDLAAACRSLAHAHSVPLVLAASEAQSAHAWMGDQQYQLPRDAASVFGNDHPFLDEVARDMVQLCHHPDAGDVVIAGWRAGSSPLTFVFEKGAHAGAGPNETRAFAILPAGTPLAAKDSEYLRPEELRAAAFHAMGHPSTERKFRFRRTTRETLRVMTYNVHCCMGLDGRLSIGRIARVLAQCDADVIALQELDASRPRSGLEDQAHELAQRLEMEAHFHPAIHVANEKYGDAILSRLPMRLVRAGTLPGSRLARRGEPRGALWVEIDLGKLKVQVLNTHLGLRPIERLEQIEALLGPDWLGHPDCREPVIFCGDLNAGPESPVCRSLQARLKDVQHGSNGRRPRGTWFSTCPLLRIDHIYVSNAFTVSKVDVPRTSFIRVASDHLPLLADVSWNT